MHLPYGIVPYLPPLKEYGIYNRGYPGAVENVIANTLTITPVASVATPTDSITYLESIVAPTAPIRGLTNPIRVPMVTITTPANLQAPAPAPTITTAPDLTCTDGSTILHTQDCTMGTPTSYCHKPEPPIECPTGSYPGVWHPGHCAELQTCYPLDASWITTKCLNGAQAYSTSTLYQGTLAGGESTVVTAVSCSCAADQWYSIGGPNADMYCMPATNCPDGMTTSTSTNTYCATAPSASCQGVATTTEFCKCADAKATPVYPDEVGGAATGCRS